MSRRIFYKLSKFQLMKSKLILFITVLSFLLAYPLEAQVVKVSNSAGKIVGEFKTTLFEVLDGVNTELGESNTANFKGLNKGQILVRLEALNWIDKELGKKNITIRKSEIRIRKDEGMQVISRSSKFRLSPKANKQLDILFEVNENGNYRIEFPFSAGTLDGRIARSVNIIGFPDNKSTLSEESIDKDNQTKTKSSDSSSKEEKTAKADEIQKESNISSSSQDDDNSRVESTPSYEIGEMEIGYDISWKENSVIHIRLKNFNNPILEVFSHPDELEIESKDDDGFNIKVKGGKSYFAKFRGDEGLLLVEFDNQLKATAYEEENRIRFHIEGGISPYTIEFLKIDEEVAKADSRILNLILDSDRNVEFSHKELSKHISGLYSTAVVSDITTESRVELPIELLIKKSNSLTNIIIFGLLGLVLIGGVLIILSQKKKKKKREEYKQMAKIRHQLEDNVSKKDDSSTEKVISKSTTIPKKITIQKSKVERTPLGFSSVDKAPKTAGKLKIKWREGNGGKLESTAFANMIESRKVQKLDLKEHWSDSVVHHVYLSESCITDLGSFLKKENLSKMQSELQGAIPEVGGFLMGNHCFQEQERIDVIIDKFVPFVPEYHDVFKIEIGTQTLVQELGDAQDKHPTMDVIGWFHTHPGHGLFLSNSDLSVQKHFAQPYQIAMEIDSLTERLDTAFFARKSGGRMNNVEHRNKGTVWFTWKEIENL